MQYVLKVNEQKSSNFVLAELQAILGQLYSSTYLTKFEENISPKFNKNPSNGNRDMDLT